MNGSLVLEDFFSRSMIPTLNLTFKPSFIVVFFRMVLNEKLFRRSNVKWSIFLMQLEKMERQRKLAKNVAYAR